MAGDVVKIGTRFSTDDEQLTTMLPAGARGESTSIDEDGVVLITFLSFTGLLCKARWYKSSKSMPLNVRKPCTAWLELAGVSIKQTHEDDLMPLT